MSDRNWERIFRPSIEALGATSINLADRIYVIGGNPNGPSTAQHLRVHCFDPAVAEGVSTTINSCGVGNRAYHSAVQISDHALLIGGELSDGSLSGDIIRCSVNDEGFFSRVCSRYGVSRKGMVGASVGPRGSEVVIIFGGCNEAEYFNDIILIKPGGADAYALKPVPLDGEKPAARAFPAFSVCGENNEYIVISGGYDGSTVLDDIWVLDATKSIPALCHEDGGPPAKAGKGGKGAAAEEPLKWTKLTLTLAPERFQHSCFSYRVAEGKYCICLTGGLNRRGILECSPQEFQLELLSGTTPKQTSEISESAILDNITNRYGATTCTVTENDGVVCAFIFGGVSVDRDPVTCFTCVDSGAGLSQELRVILSQRKTELDAQETAALNESNPDASATQCIEFSNGDCYEGEVFRGNDAIDDSVPHGIGTMKYADGSSYQGLWEMGVKSGHGQLSDCEGNLYVGNFANDCFNGSGKYTVASSGEEFEGTFVNNSVEGRGFWRDKKGNTYEGDFIHNVKHGSGTLYSGVGDGTTGNNSVLYSGEWADGHPSGRGTLHLMVEAEGTGGLMIPAKYEGEVSAGLPNGSGECFYSDGSHYAGQWRRQLRNGFGKFTSANGDEYDGKWVADKRCGKGIWRSYRGDRYTGQWESDVPHGAGEYCYASGAVYSGSWCDGKCQGEGKMIYADTSEYAGSWKNGSWHGHGSWRGVVRSDGEVSYVGEWVDGARNGIGTSTYSSGDQYTGRFVNDRPSASYQKK